MLSAEEDQTVLEDAGVGAWLKNQEPDVGEVQCIEEWCFCSSQTHL